MRSRPLATTLLSGEGFERGPAGDDETIAQLANRQHGNVSRKQLLALGIGRRAIDHRRKVGRLRRVHPGVYGVGHDPLSLRARLSAALLSVGGGGAGSHLCATAIQGVTPEPSGALRITIDAKRAHRSGVVIHRAPLPRDEIVVVDGIPLTTVARALLDLAATLPPHALRRALREAEFQGLVDDASIALVLERHRTKPGHARLAALVGRPGISSARTRSQHEDRFLRFCVAYGIPLPEINALIHVRGKAYEVDFAWRSAKVIVELDDRSSHRGTVAFETDRARDRAFTAAGWAPMRVTPTQLNVDPDPLAREILETLKRGSDDLVTTRF